MQPIHSIRPFTRVIKLFAAAYFLLQFLSSGAAAQNTTTTWTINAKVDNGSNECANANFPCNGSVSGTIVTTLVSDPRNGTSAGPTASLPAGLPQIPVVTSVNLTVAADYNDKCCVLNGISGTANATISLSGGGDFFLTGGTGTLSGLPTAYANSSKVALPQGLAFPTSPGVL